MFEASVDALAEIEAAFDERVQFVATLASNYKKALQKIATLKDKDAKNTAQTERLTKEFKGKKPILQRLRALKQRYKSILAPWPALRECFRKRTDKDERRPGEGNAASAGRAGEL